MATKDIHLAPLIRLILSGKLIPSIKDVFNLVLRERKVVHEAVKFHDLHEYAWASGLYSPLLSGTGKTNEVAEPK